MTEKKREKCRYIILISCAHGTTHARKGCWYACTRKSTHENQCNITAPKKQWRSVARSESNDMKNARTRLLASTCTWSFCCHKRAVGLYAKTWALPQVKMNNSTTLGLENFFLVWIGRVKSYYFTCSSRKLNTILIWIEYNNNNMMLGDITLWAKMVLYLGY